MEIKIQIFGRVYSICIGRKTKWFSQVDLITICKEEYENMNITWADLKFHFWRKGGCKNENV